MGTMAWTSSLPPLGSNEQREDVWNLVIKVNYGDTLRRFSAYVHQKFMIIEYDMNKLRSKISCLFKFSPDAVLVLTYTDEDGDEVVLDNDDELCAAVILQKLNPLRITVQIKSYSTDGYYSGQSAVTISDCNSGTGSDKAIPAHNGFPQLAAALNSTVENSLKSVPEPIRGALLNIFHDVIEAASSVPIFSELLLLLSKLQLTNVTQSSHEPTGNPVCMSFGTPSLLNSNIDDKPKVSDDPHNQLPTVLPHTNFVCPITGNIQKMHEAGQSKQCLGFINYAPVIFDQHMSKGQKEGCDVHRNRKSMVAAKLPSLSSITQGSTSTSESFDKPNSNIAPMFLHGNSSINMLPYDATTRHPFDSMFSLKQQDGSTYHVDVLGNKPFASPIAFPAHSPMLHPYERSSDFFDGMRHTFHRGIICDGCGMHPIMGPIYKSTVFENYVLCSTCFQYMGCETEYVKIDRSSFPFPEGVKDQHKLYSSQLATALASHNRVKEPTPKLDSCFVRDVTVWDGTVMSPCSRFTKIWKMRNNGTISWPFGTQLVRVRGAYLGGHDKANLKIPETGFPVDEELDIAVNFFAPSVPGQYTSFWQMVSPFGHKFGEEIWVIIQVDDHQSASTFLNLSLSPKGNQQNNKVIVDVDAELLDSNILSVFPEMLNSTRLVSSSVLQSSNDSPASAFMSSIPLLVASEMFNSAQKDSTSVLPFSSQISNPYFDISEFVTPVSYPPVDIPSLTNHPSDVLTEEDLVEQSLLRELDDMGFKQIDLNKEILRQNQYDLEQSLEDLCGFFE